MPTFLLLLKNSNLNSYVYGQFVEIYTEIFITFATENIPGVLQKMIKV